MTTHNFLAVDVTFAQTGNRVLPSLGELTTEPIGGAPAPQYPLNFAGAAIETYNPFHELCDPSVKKPSTKRALAAVASGDSLLVTEGAAECLLVRHLNEVYHDNEAVRLYTVTRWDHQGDRCIAAVKYEGEVCLGDIQRLGW